MNVSAISAAGPLLYAAAPATVMNRPIDSIGGVGRRDGGGDRFQVQDVLDLRSARAVDPTGPKTIDSTQSAAANAVDRNLDAAAKSGQAKENEKTGKAELSKEELEQVEELKDRDREVRTHEQAHKAAAGPYAQGGPTYEYQRGPDGQNYAVGGSVEIDTAPVEGDPEATIEKAQVVRAAALAPAEPSAQDRKVAAAASKMLAQAQSELIAEKFDFGSAASASSGKYFEAADSGQFLDLLA